VLTCTKRYSDFPFAHRAPKHDGHCKLIHGHNWSFEFTFAASERDENGFVMDFGKLKDLRDALNGWFDHTLVLNDGDPLREPIQTFLVSLGLNNVVLVPDCSCEGIAMLAHKIANVVVVKLTDARVCVKSVTVYEDSKNSATYGAVA